MTPEALTRQAEADTVPGMADDFKLANPSAGRVAYWRQRSRGRVMSLWEGTGGFGSRLFATVEKGRDGLWDARYGIERPETFRDKESALRAMSVRTFAEFDLEIRTTTRTLVPRPGGIAVRDEADPDPSPRP